jgi:hypothetical protein
MPNPAARELAAGIAQKIYIIREQRVLLDGDLQAGRVRGF